MYDSAKRLRPLGNRVLLRKIESGNSGGIVKPQGVESEDMGALEYEVVESTSSSLAPGERVYLPKSKSWKLEHDGEELYAAEVEDILAVEESA